VANGTFTLATTSALAASVFNQGPELNYFMYASSNISWDDDASGPSDHINSGSVESFGPEDLSDDPVRTARDNWAVRRTVVSDSSEIIDSIDVDMIDVRKALTRLPVFTWQLSRLMKT
jgi:hypothetical protein